MLAWSVGNAEVEVKGNAAIITKQASGTAKVDPSMNPFDAVVLISINPPVPDVRLGYEELPTSLL